MAAKKDQTIQTGSVDIPLTRPLDIDGAKVAALRMREPTVADQLAAEEAGGTAAAQELALIANLCMMAPDQIKALTLRDYKKVQVAFMGFII